MTGGTKRFCPFPDCDQVIDLSNISLLGGVLSAKLRCPKCSNHFCKDCGFAWHQGVKCKEVIKKELGEWVLTSKYVNKCPKCRSRVEKASGCQHMTCGMCRYEWCWVCGMPYNSIIHYKEIGYTFCEMIGQSYFKSSKCYTIILMLLIGVFMPFIVYFLGMHGVGFGFIKLFDIIKTTSYGRKFVNFRVDFFS